MPKKPLIPKNDAERNALVYRSYEEPLRRAFLRYSTRAAKDMFSAIRQVLEAAGYDGSNRLTIMVRQADPATVRRLEEIAERLPDEQRRRVLSKLYGEIGNGNLTVRRAIRDITNFRTAELTNQIYEAGKKGLMAVASEGMMRSEFMVIKGMGLGWTIEAPGTQRVEAFMRSRWTLETADGYTHPLNQVVKDEISQGLLLGESPKKIANRLEEVGSIEKVRAERMARTTVTMVSNQAQMDTYERQGIKKYRFSCTFDERTCPVCGALDGKIFNVEDQQPGVNAPYMHPNCRCTTYAVIDKRLSDRTTENMRRKHPDWTFEVDPNETYEHYMERTNRK